MKIPIYHFKEKCLSCKKEIDMYYPEELAFIHGLGNLKENHKITQKRKTIANICSYCNSYQDTRFVRKHFLELCNNSGIRDFCIWIEENLLCTQCGEKIDYDIDKKEPQKLIDFFSGDRGKKCLSCINEKQVESLVEKLNKMKRCPVCDRLILDDQDFHKNITLDDKTIISSKPNKHHINYKENKIIIVCSECHSKIHNSKKKKYKEYRPVDQRTKKK